jgi:uncharacterized protein
MSGINITVADEAISARASGALHLIDRGILCISDLHLGRTERIAREGGHIIPPYENTDTLKRLEDEIHTLNPATVICLGDSFDDLTASKSLTDSEYEWIIRLQAGREWVWVEGNHDPAPLDLGGTHRRVLNVGSLIFRHIAEQNAVGEISGHYHPKFTLSARGRGITRPCFLFDQNRLIMPAFGTYTGGMNITRAPLCDMFGKNAQVVMTGKSARHFRINSMS